MLGIQEVCVVTIKVIRRTFRVFEKICHYVTDQ